jgi:hypothetical protein
LGQREIKRDIKRVLPVSLRSRVNWAKQGLIED